MEPHQHHFIQTAIQLEALKFGEFTLKSGRKSPYFFNMGVFQTGEMLAKLGSYYANTIDQQAPEFDVLYGPAYKGIPLACATAIQLSELFKRPTPYCFNRKEAKDHGEKGSTVGAPLNNKILIIDDVITAGTAIHDAAAIIQQAEAELAGVIIALDRQERGQNTQSATQEVSKRYDVPVIAIVTLTHIIDYLTQTHYPPELIDSMHTYRKQYGSY